MHFCARSAGAVVLALHVLLSACIAGSAAAGQQTFVRVDVATTVQPDGDGDEPFASTTPYGGTDSPVTVTPSDPNGGAVIGHGTDVPVDSQAASEKIDGSPWVQKIQSARPRNMASPPSQQRLGSPAGRSVLLGQVISNVLYGDPWTATERTNPRCAADLKVYAENLQNFTLWAAKLLDASSKGPEGILDGNTHSFGNFDQCLGTKSKVHGITGGYSLVDIDYRPSYNVYSKFYDGDHSKDFEPLDEDKSAWDAIKNNIQEDYVQRHKFQWAVCLPETCQYEDVVMIIRNKLIPELNRHGMEGNVTIDPLLHSSSQNLYKYTTGFYMACAVLVALSLVVFVGTVYDLVYLQYRPKSEHGPMKQIMKPFSLISNIERLLKPSESEEFSIINGLKVCAILQVILGHRWMIEFGLPEANPNFVSNIIHNIFFGHFKCSIFLETFFVISGFLTFNIITKMLAEKKSLNFGHIMVYRWLRIFPVYGTMIAMYVFILPYLNDGPFWKSIVYRETERCESNWWTNVLFINNYVNTDGLCIIPSWYLACDMHYFIVGTLITYAIWKWRRPGLAMLGALFTLSVIIPIYVIIKDNQRGLPDIYPNALKDLSKDRFYTEFYIKTHMRAMPYFLGIIAAYIYMKLKEVDYQLSMKRRSISVIACLFIGNCIYFSTGLFYLKEHHNSAYEHAAYFTINRFLWAFMVSYGIVGHGLNGFGVCISGFLGHRIFHVLGKLVFCVYMYQEIIQIQTIASVRTPTYQNFTLIAWRWAGDTLFAFMYAFAINVMIESPFDRLQKNVMKMFFGNMFSKPKQTPQISTEINIENKSSNSMA